jgi:hypothetical protein
MGLFNRQVDSEHILRCQPGHSELVPDLYFYVLVKRDYRNTLEKAWQGRKGRKVTV